MRREPREALNAYANWALYAIAGALREADAIMREHGESVRLVAKFLCARRPFERRPTYRGLLLESWRVPEGRVLSPRSCDGSSSWTEDRDVAAWFADKGAVIAQFVAEIQPDVRGWLATRAAPEPAEVLWHWTWAREIDLPELARRHPGLREVTDQVEWNLETQREVILAPTFYAVDPFEPGEDAEALNERLTHPRFRAARA